jgi:hypothetical protein
MNITNLAFLAILPRLPAPSNRSPWPGIDGYIPVFNEGDFSMRRLMSMLVAACFLASMAGCCANSCGSRGSCGGGGGHGISQGMCDCEMDDHCLERSPWLRFGAGVTGEQPAGEPIPVAPTKLPDGKRL